MIKTFSTLIKGLRRGVLCGLLFFYTITIEHSWIQCRLGQDFIRREKKNNTTFLNIYGLWTATTI